MPNIEIEFTVPVSKEEFCEVARRELVKIPNYIFSEDGETFLIKEGKVDLLNGTYPVKADIEYQNGIVTICAKCAGIGPFQKKHVNEVADIIRGVIERGGQEKDNEINRNETLIRCPKCGSNQIQIQKRGWSLTTGLIGSGKNERVCMQCMFKF